jgi:tetratricopeptide (TPR) repeat protein
LAHQYDLALPPLKKALEEDAKSPLAHSILGQVYEQQGRYPQAISEFRNAVADSGGVVIYIVELAHAEAEAGKRTEALRTLAELKRLATQRFVPPDEIAKIYIALGDKKSAFAWLEKAYQEHSASLVDIKIDPEFDQLRNDQRFQQLVRRMGFP